MPDVVLPSGILATTVLNVDLPKYSLCIDLVPSKAFDRVCQDLSAYLSMANQSIAWATKGIDPITNQSFSNLLKDTYRTKILP